MRHLRHLLLASLISSVGLAPAVSQTPAGAPVAAESHLDAQKLGRIDDVIRAKVEHGELAGMVILAAQHGRVQHASAIGYADAQTRKPIDRASLFRIYSMTKPIAAVALLMLYEEGKFALDDPISRYIPAFKNVRVLRTPASPMSDTVPAATEPTIHDLFRHTAGFSHGLAANKNQLDVAYLDANLFGRDVSLETMVDRLARLPLHQQPGTKWEYSVSPDVEARLVEILSGMPFRDFVRTRLTIPLGMKDTDFWAGAGQSDRLVPVHRLVDGKLVPCRADIQCPVPEHFLMQPSELNGYGKPRAHTGGSYGLVSTPDDYLRFAQMLLNGGQLDGKRYLGMRTVSYMMTDHLGAIPMPDVNGRPSGAGWGLGAGVVKDAAANGSMQSPGTFYWGGIAGTTFWIDPKADIVVVAMTQHMSVPAVNDAYASLKAVVYGALVP